MTSVYRILYIFRQLASPEKLPLKFKEHRHGASWIWGVMMTVFFRQYTHGPHHLNTPGTSVRDGHRPVLHSSQSFQPTIHSFIHLWSWEALKSPYIISIGSMSNRVQWFSQLDEIHQQKDAKEYSQKCSLKKFFNWLSHFLRICILLVLTYTHICTQWPQKNFCSFLAYEYSKFAEFYADFKSVEIIKKKSAQKKLFAKHFCKLVV